MKKLLFVAVMAIVLVGCGSKDEPKVFKLDPNAMISIRPATGAWKAPYFVKTTDSHLSALEIVKQTAGISFQNLPLFGNQSVDAGFANSQKDTISNPPCLKMWGTSIISQQGLYVPDFIESTDLVFCRTSPTNYGKRDTVAYIPNAVLRAAELQIKTALEAKDTTAVYRIFNEAFTFTPITGTEWKNLKLLNQQ